MAHLKTLISDLSHWSDLESWNAAVRDLGEGRVEAGGRVRGCVVEILKL